MANPFESRAYYIEVLSEFLSNTLRVGVTVSDFCLSNDIINKPFFYELKSRENPLFSSLFLQHYYAAVHEITITLTTVLPGSHVAAAASLVRTQRTRLQSIVLSAVSV